MNLFSRIIKKLRVRYYLRKGYSRHYTEYWMDNVKNAYKSSNLPEKEKKWAYKHGFFPWRIAQYGLTESNYQNFISDEAYYYLYPLNQDAQLVSDKLTLRYTLAPFAKYLPEYYYLLTKNREVMRLMDLPEEYPGSFDGIIALLKEKKVLAAKDRGGSQGRGFYKFEATPDGILVNNEKKTEEEFLELLKKLRFSGFGYIITEYIQMHPMLKAINPYSVNTIRAVILNRNGNDPIFPYAFIRFGTKGSGVVDNISQGGMVCKIDVNTGRFYDAQTLKDHVFTDVEVHPETHEKASGFLPNWELVKNTLLEIARYCPQLRWLGVDVAITADGFKIVEINVHQMLHKAHEYPPEVMDFLLSELDKKKKRYHLK